MIYNPPPQGPQPYPTKKKLPTVVVVVLVLLVLLAGMLIIGAVASSVTNPPQSAQKAGATASATSTAKKGSKKVKANLDAIPGDGTFPIGLTRPDGVAPGTYESKPKRDGSGFALCSWSIVYDLNDELSSISRNGNSEGRVIVKISAKDSKGRPHVAFTSSGCETWKRMDW